MKRYEQFTHRDEKGNPVIEDVGVVGILVDALDELLAQGIREDAHHWGQSWLALDDVDLEEAMKNDDIIDDVLKRLRVPLLERLQQALEERRNEKMRHP